MVLTTSTPCGLPYTIPFEPYTVQSDMMRIINKCLNSISPPVPVAALEVPTGCGKTLALLSSVLQYQASLGKFTPDVLKQHLHEREFKHGSIPLMPVCSHHGVLELRKGGNECEMNGNVIDWRDIYTGDNNEEHWGVSTLFFKQFRPQTGKCLRVEMNSTSLDLRRQHGSPPCTIFYITRTHAQVRQAVGELRKLKELKRLKMNILGSRERYCINNTVLKSRANKTLPVEGNNLGEICDKLVSLGQCEAVHTYSALANNAISRPICRGRSDKVWDMEDLITEGVGTQSCPYYAARDLVFFAHINFATYQYLLDPIIRHECKMEAALRNHSIIIFDEAHNVPLVCQEALSLETPVNTLRLILSEIEPLLISSTSVPTLSYPREFKLTYWTLVELFTLLYDIFNGIVKFVEKQDNCGMESHSNPPKGWKKRNMDSTNNDNENERQGLTLPGESISNIIRQCIKDHLTLIFQKNGVKNKDGSNESSSSIEGVAMFRQIYGIVMSLGVTFNPFQFSIFTLSIMKRWLLVMRFVLLYPVAFAINIRDGVLSNVNGNNFNGLEEGMGKNLSLSSDCKSIGIRCLDGSLGFYHLLRSSHRIILASGTLAPFDQLSKEIGVPLFNMMTYEGGHVVKSHQYRLTSLTQIKDSLRLHCNYKNFIDKSFIQELVSIITTLVEKVKLGGTLLFFPNYTVMRVVGSLLIQHYRKTSNYNNNSNSNNNTGISRIPHVFLETQTAIEFPSMLDAFSRATISGTAILASVYRGKVSEGIDFADNMARLVICIGIPLQPLKSWTVIAQRRYSGEDWYITDAIRAVNQALGRCLRHCRDYGAVVLLDDRYEQESIQKRLSKWCRDSLKVYHKSECLLNELYTFYTQFKKTCDNNNNNNNNNANSMSSEPLKEASAKGTIIITQTPHLVEVSKIPPTVLKRDESKKDKSAEALFPFSVKSVKRSRPTTCTHDWSCTAVKLLYESHNSVENATAAELRELLHMLEDEYMETDEE